MEYIFLGAHPDDCELFAGGLIAKLVAEENNVTIVDLTSGEMATRGTLEERVRERTLAAKILGISQRITLDLKDTVVENSIENRLQIIEVIRNIRPAVIVYHHTDDTHPDHRKAAAVVRDAIGYSNIEKIDTGQERFAPKIQIRFYGHCNPAPTFVVDITDFFERKIEAVKAYASQFYNPDYDAPTTTVSSKEFFENIETRARYFGAMIGATYGEPFFCKLPIPLSDPRYLLQT